VHGHRNVDVIAVVHGREEFHLELARGEAEAVAEDLGVRPPYVPREEVLEGLVQEVHEVGVVRDAGGVEVAEADEDGRLEHYALLPRCSMIETDRISPRASKYASPSSALAAVGSPK